MEKLKSLVDLSGYLLNQKENFIHMKNSLQKMAVAQLNEMLILFGNLEVKMSPTRYCEAIQCTDCDHYTECLEYQIKTNELKGKLLTEIKAIIKMED